MGIARMDVIGCDWELFGCLTGTLVYTDDIQTRLVDIYRSIPQPTCKSCESGCYVCELRALIKELD